MGRTPVNQKIHFMYNLVFFFVNAAKPTLPTGYVHLSLVCVRAQHGVLKSITQVRSHWEEHRPLTQVWWCGYIQGALCLQQWGWQCCSQEAAACYYYFFSSSDNSIQ